MRTALATIDDPMMETRGIAAMLERSYRDVRDGGLSINEFERRARSALSLRNARRTQMMIRAWRAYERLIADLPAVDPADALERAATLIETRKVLVAPQIIAGFYDMTGAQIRLLTALESTGKLTAIFVPIGEGDSYAFASRFVTQIDARPGGLKPVIHIKAPATSVAQYDTKELELRAVCSTIRELLDAGTPPSEIGIATRTLDPDDVRLLQRFAAELQFTFTARTDISLLAHRLGRGIAAILRLRERNFPRGEVIEILRDGYQPRKHVNVDWLDVSTRKARISGSDPAVDEYRGVVAELESLAPISRTLLGMGWASLLRQATAKFRLETEIDLAATAAIDDIAALLSRWKQQISADSVIDLFEQTSLNRQPATDNRQPVVWAGDVMKFRGRTFKHLFVVRTQEGTFPQRRIDDPLLPDSDRRQLKIREIGDGRDEERLLFQLLLDGAETSIHFSHASSDGFGKILRPSRMVKDVGPALSRSAPAREPALRSPNLPRQIQLIERSGTRSVFDGYLLDDEKIRKLITNELQSISPTELEDYGECPQKFLFKHIFGVTEYDDPEHDLQMHRREKGKLDHMILERFYKSIDALPPGDLQGRIDTIVDAAFDEEEARVPAFNRVMRNIERRATKRNLRAFLAADIDDLLENGLQPKYFEYKFGPKHLERGPVDHPEPFVITTHDVSIRVEGSIDRIDEGAEALRIVDYKSGKAGRHVNLAEKIDRGVRLQLALYALAVSDFFNRPAASISGVIKPLMVRGTDADKMRFQLGDAEPRLRQTLDLFVQSMLRGAFPAFPNDEDDIGSCRYCPVNHSCRTRHAEAERRAVERQNDARTLLENLP
jgi:ATP-dependent helicase/DNAse subunit B